jgi:ferrochelatase
MRNWHPFLDDTLADMAAAGVERALGIVLAAHHSYSSCGQYRQNVAQARRTLRARGVTDVEVLFAPGWHAHDGFVEANARQIDVARRDLPGAVRQDARIVFTAHSIPRSMAGCARYVAELEESAGLVSDALRASNWEIVYQSRSGRPTDPWLEPDVCDYLRAERERGLQAVVLAPLGFVADHIEVLYDLDTEAAAVCRELGVAMGRASAVNDHPAFLDALADVVRSASARVGGGRLLPIVPAAPPERVEGPPPAR